MAKKPPPKKDPPRFNDVYIRAISNEVYRKQLGADDTARMLEKDDDGGKKLDNRAGQYDSLTRLYLEVITEALKC